MKQLFQFCVCLALVACTRSPLVGNGEAYNGGSELEARLEAARNKLLLGVDKASSLFPAESMCNPVVCNTQDPSKHCDVLRGLSSQQRSECQGFLAAHLKEVASLHTGAHRPALLVSAAPLTVREDGKDRVVDAKTNLGRAGDIIFNYDRVSPMAYDDVLALLFHESGHKLSTSIRDEGPVGSFDSGRQLLDTAASAFTVMVTQKDSIGFFLVDTKRYYANKVGEYCEFPDLNQWLIAGGSPIDSFSLKLSQLPSTLYSTGTCPLRGFFSMAGIGYYGNSLQHYCGFSTYQDWVRAGGPQNEADILSYTTLSPRMVYDGNCP